MHFSLDGNYIDSDDVPFRTICNFQISSTGYYITATSKGDWNNHLGPIADYKLLYTDSLGNLQKAACYYQESEHNQLVYDPVRRLENDILYVPMYLNEVYTVTDTTLSLRYKFMTSVLKNCCKYPEYSVILILFLILLRVFMLTKITLSQ